jgi:DNA-binding IclR family transcriptional regulator
VPLHATSSGKAWLAWLPPREVGDLLPATLEPFTAATITDTAALRSELDAIRTRGYGTCSGEFEAQLYGVSAPVLDGSRPVAVVSIWGPGDRITPDRFPRLGELAMAAADELATSLRSGAA